MSIQGLSGFKKSQESRGAKFFKPKPDTKVKIRPLAELDFDAKNYSQKNGLALFTTEYQHPDNFRLSFVDTFDTEGRSVGKEMADKYGWKQPDPEKEPEKAAAWQNWRPKQRLYLPVLLLDGDNGEEVVVLQLGIGPKQVQYNALVECHENNGSITDRVWVYGRKGDGQYNTVYSLAPLDRDDKLPDVEDYEVPDLEQFVNHVPYAQQRAYLGLDRGVAEPQEGEKVGASSGDGQTLNVDW